MATRGGAVEIEETEEIEEEASGKPAIHSL